MVDLAVLGNRLIEASAYMTGYNTFKLVLDYEDEDGKIRTYNLTFNMVPSKENEIFEIEVN